MRIIGLYLQMVLIAKHLKSKYIGHVWPVKLGNWRASISNISAGVDLSHTQLTKVEISVLLS